VGLRDWVNTPAKAATTAGLVGLPLTAIVTVVAGYYSFESRVSNLEAKVATLSRPIDSHAAQCEQAVVTYTQAVSALVPSSQTTIDRLEELMVRLGCVGPQGSAARTGRLPADNGSSSAP